MNLDIITIFLGGIATVFTPCILPVLPVYLGIFASSAGSGKKLNLFIQTLLFGLGFSILFILMGLGAASVSNFLIANKVFITIVGATLIVIMGLLFSGIIKVPFMMREYRLSEKSLIKENSKFTSFFSGIIFAAGWSPCAGPILGSVLTYVALKSTNVLTGSFLMGIYSLGILTPFILLSLFSDSLLPKIRRFYNLIPYFQKAGGILLILGGLLLIYSNIPYLNVSLDSEKENYLSLKISGKEKPEILFVFSRNCPECKALHAILPEIKNDCKGMDIVINEVFIEDYPHIKQKLGINAVPTIILFDRYNKEVKRVFGSQDISTLRIAAASLINNTCAGEAPDINKVKSTDSICAENSSCKESVFQ